MRKSISISSPDGNNQAMHLSGSSKFAAHVALLLALVVFLPQSCLAEWQWIFSDDTCSVYADLSSLKVWDKPEGSCIDIRLKTRLTEKGAKKFLTGREINSLPTGGDWQKLRYIVSRQLFMRKEPRVQMMSLQYLTDGQDVIETKTFEYAANRWQPIQKKERSQAVYAAVVKIAGN